MALRTRPGFTVLELAAVLAIALVLIAVLLPLGNRQRQAGGLAISLANLQQILAATADYRSDHDGQTPLRMGQFITCSISGWSNWSFGGKNNNIYWQSLSIGDESAYARRLNAYIFGGTPWIPKPPNYPTCPPSTFAAAPPGRPTSDERLTLEIPVYRSPGDRATRQRAWPNPTPGISCYDDVGTSYQSNMAWFDTFTSPPFSLGFTGAFMEGYRRIRTIESSPWASTFVWVWDQMGTINYASPAGANGEFSVGEGFKNDRMTTCGYLDGHATYIPIQYGTIEGPGYRLVP